MAPMTEPTQPEGWNPPKPPVNRPNRKPPTMDPPAECDGHEQADVVFAGHGRAGDEAGD
jgi:hypothetical protein